SGVIYSVGLAAGFSSSFQFKVMGGTGPWTLAPGSELIVDVRFVPKTRGGLADDLVLYTSDLNAPEVRVALEGRGVNGTQRVDTFKQLEDGAADVLFVVDNTGSMSDDQQALALNFPSFIKRAETLDVTFQIGVTTTDVDEGGEKGALVAKDDNPKIITQDTPDLEKVFGENVQVGTHGSGIEQGLEAARLALGPNLLIPLEEGGNKGFVRDDAKLAVIVVSDEDDGSPMSLDDYAESFRPIKGTLAGEKFTFHAIVATDEDCGTIGKRYIDMAKASDGTSQNLCDDWSSTLENIADKIFTLPREFRLSHEPIEDTIKVEVNGSQVEPGNGDKGWIYIGRIRSIVFGKDDIPPAGAEIRVIYEAACIE
ncbi:MAG: VWA domain-containing protein, partial [Deltaproteobacteria bacterium]|nr:VWA domain-containing protein [Deltaproteobacteria bacterium]